MRIKYRPEVDGLRAIAVISVIIYHAEIYFGETQFFKGGFLGVDVFFVISGFLITSIILGEHKISGQFSIKNFYERRARRILPALLVVMFVSIPIAWYVLYPSQLLDFSKSILSTLIFASNFYWDMTLQEYGAESALFKPFLHTWTLAVEEQFYIIYPFIILVIFYFFRNYAIVLLSCALLLSLQFAESLTVRDPSLSFYMLPSRFWELLFGGLVAFYVHQYPQKKSMHYLYRIMPTIGLFLIIFSLLFINLKQHHPGYITLTPVVGTVLIIFFANENDFVTKLLASKLFVFIGLISYSLYLWHYPIFSFGRIIDDTPTWDDKGLWIVLTIIFSTLTYFYIEKPFRNKKIITFKRFMLFVGAAIFISTSVLLFLMKYSSGLVVDIDLDEKMIERTNWNEYGYDVCNQVLPSDCINKNLPNKSLLVVGDSMVPDAVRIIAKQYPEFRFVTSSAGGCIPSSLNLSRSMNKLEECNALNKTRFNPRSIEDIDGVVIITLSYEDEKFVKIKDKPKIKEYVEYLKSNGVENILIFGSYVRHKPKIHDLYLKTGGDKQKIEDLVRTYGKNNDIELKEFSEANEIEFISIREIMCPQNSECPVYIDNSPYSWDGHHWSVEFTDYLFEKMKTRLSKTWLNKSPD
ncbi:MAG: acyltransferase [Gammaproteobacteria bacterium]|nr:acyltransferase [Gammaproteobacteria bacterium]